MSRECRCSAFSSFLFPLLGVPPRTSLANVYCSYDISIDGKAERSLGELATRVTNFYPPTVHRAGHSPISPQFRPVFFRFKQMAPSSTSAQHSVVSPDGKAWVIVNPSRMQGGPDRQYPHRTHVTRTHKGGRGYTTSKNPVPGNMMALGIQSRRPPRT